MAIDGGKILSSLELDTSKYTTAMTQAQQQMGSFANSTSSIIDRIGGIGRAMTSVGSALTIGVSLPLLSVGTAATKASIEFESAFAGVRKTVDATEAEYAQLRSTLLDMTKEIPETANNLAGIMEIAGQLGVDKGNLASFTHTIADLGVATNLSGEEAATMLAQYANVTGMDLTNIDRLGSTIVALGNNTATTERDIANMAQRISGMAQNIGLTDAQVMGLAATMASLGIEAEGGGSAISRTMASMQQAVLGSGKQLDAFAKAAKTDAKTFADAFRSDPVQALNLFIAGLGKSKDAGEDVYAVLEEVELSELRVTDALLRMTGAGDSLTNNITLANQAWSDNNALTAEASQRYATTESKLQLAKNAVNRLMISLGDQLLPAVTSVIDKITGFVEGLGELDEGMLETIVTVGLVLAAIGPVMTLMGGLVTLFTGPLGLVAAVGLGGVALAAVVSHFATLKQAEIDADLAARFDGIILSAASMDKIIAAGFTAPNINVDAVNDAKTKVDDAVTSVNTLQTTLAEALFTVTLGATGDMANLPEIAASFASGVQTFLAEEKNLCKLTVTSHFGADDPDGTTLQAELDTYYGGLEAQAAAKGKALRQAMDNAIADGVIDDEERKTIAALQAELIQIMAEGTLIQGQVEIKKLNYDIRSTPMLDPESYREFLSRIRSATDQARNDADNIFEDTKEMTFELAISASWSDEQLDAELAKIAEQQGDNIAVIDAQDIGLQFSLASQMISSFAGEMDTMQNGIATLVNTAWNNALRLADEGGYDLSTDEGAAFVKSRFNEQIKAKAGTLEDLVPEEVRSQAQIMYQEMAPTEQTLLTMKARYDAAGQELPQMYQDMLTSIEGMKLLSMDGDAMAEELKLGIEGATPEVLASAESIAHIVLQGANSQLSEIYTVGADYGQGYCNGLLSKVAAAQAAGRKLTQAAIDSGKQTQDSNSPSRVAKGLGQDYGDGYTGGIYALLGNAKKAGAGLVNQTLEGMREAGDMHSPSRKAEEEAENINAGYVNTLNNGVTAAGNAGAAQVNATITQYGIGAAGAASRAATISAANAAAKEKREEAAAKRAAAAAKRRREAEAAAAQRQAEYELAIIKQSGAELLEAEAATGNARIAQIAKQTTAMMATIGATSIWYQDTSLDKETGDVEGYYQAKMDALQAQYDNQKAQLKSKNNQTQLDAAKDAFDKRMAQLKNQQKAEIAAIKEQYATQKDIALRWLETQQELAEQALSDKQEAAQQEDYQDQLADLQKQLRQSKSARERRELQEEIDRLQRDEAIRQEEQQLQVVLDGYAALREAINAGLIGLGDLTGDTAYGDIAFGSAGLAALDNISASQLQAVLASLTASAIPATNSSAGNTYQLDLRGATVRDDSDIQAIVDEFEARMRSSNR